MKCPICNNDTDSRDANVTLCTNCKHLNRSELFSKILAVLLDIYSTNKGFDAVKGKCVQFDPIIQRYPLYITPFCKFDPDEHDTDRVALHFLRNYVKAADNNTLQKHQPIKIDTPASGCLYTTIAILCRLDIEDGARELRVRNIVDMILNAEVYQTTDPKLHVCLEWPETWKYFVLEQLREKQLTTAPDAVLTLSLHSLSNIINMKIRSVYPEVSGGNDDLRKRLDRIFSLLNIQLSTTVVPTITILWSNTKSISSHSTSSMWMPDCVVPLLPKSDCYTNDPVIFPRASSAALQNPAERSFYILSCFCPITQAMLNEVVSDSDQKKHSEAEIKKEKTKLPEFRCPKCSKPCNDYGFDRKAVQLFRQNFTGARFTYILVDITSSMTYNLPHTGTTAKTPTLPRIIQTKEAIKQLLQEISVEANPLDQAILTTFNDKLIKPALIPLCKASEIATESNLTRIDAIELSPRSVKTHVYSVLKEVYEMVEREPFLYVDVYLFSDGVDTSSRKNDTMYQAIIRGLNEKIGAKCHFMNCGSASEGFSVAAWLGDEEADRPISGSIDDIKTQIKADYKRDHAKNPVLTIPRTRSRGDPPDIPPSTTNIYMTDAEAASIRKPRPTDSSKDGTSPSNPPLPSCNPNATNLDDYLDRVHSSTHTLSATATDNRLKSSDASKILTRNPNTRRRH